MTSSISQKYIAILTDILHASQLASRHIKHAFTTPSSASHLETKQNSTDLVTETDQNVEKLIFGYLKERYSMDSFKYIGEETQAESSDKGYALTQDGTFIVDPVDGTTNFVHRNENIAISIAYFEGGRPQVAVCVNPIKDDTYWAVRGMGTFKNGLPVHVSQVRDLSKAIVTTNVGYDRSEDSMKNVLSVFNGLLGEKKCHGLRMTGAAVVSCMMVSEGSAEAYFEKGIHIWDIAAGALLVTEAGGVVMDPAGGEIDWCSRRVLVASNAEVAKEIADIYKRHDQQL